jgi:hypothetical protein
MLEAGTYAARVALTTDKEGKEVAVLFGESAKKGTPFAQVICQVIRGPHARETITWQGYFSGGATDHTVKALRAFGFTGDELASMPEQRPENEVQIVVEMEESQNGGRSWPKVAWVNAPNRGMKIDKPIAGPDLRKFSAKLKSNLKSAPAVVSTKAVLEEPSAAAPSNGEQDGWPESGQSQSREDEGEGAPLGSDDIPF